MPTSKKLARQLRNYQPPKPKPRPVLMERDPYAIWIDPSKPAPQRVATYVTPTKQERDEALGKVGAFVVGVVLLLLAVFGNGGNMQGWEYILGVPGMFAVGYGLSED